MTSTEAIAYLRTITSGDPRAQEALDTIEMLGQTADVLGELHEREIERPADGHRRSNATDGGVGRSGRVTLRAKEDEMAVEKVDVKAEARSLLEWLDGWGDGPNWSDASGATVPVVKASLRRVLEHVNRTGIPGCVYCDGSGVCLHCDVASKAM
jgi:hypothetical protein